ncbi:hypothetical protein CFP66_42315 [Pseudonocardia sp. MH-G8]|nr:hypothetical protein CFP66_42315 [Pseudonocardia sp. MH-G8]
MRKPTGSDGKRADSAITARRTHRHLSAHRPGLTIIADKGSPSYRNRAPHPAEHPLKPVRQLVESIFDPSACSP